MYLRAFVFLYVIALPINSKAEILSYNFFDGAFGLYENRINELESGLSEAVKINASTYIKNQRDSPYDWFFIHFGVSSITGGSSLNGSRYRAGVGYDQILNNRTSFWAASNINRSSFQYHHVEEKINSEGSSSFYFFRNTEIFPSLQFGVRNQASENIEISASFTINGNNNKSLDLTLAARYKIPNDFYILAEIDYFDEGFGGLLGLGKYFSYF